MAIGAGKQARVDIFYAEPFTAVSFYVSSHYIYIVLQVKPFKNVDCLQQYIGDRVLVV